MNIREAIRGLAMRQAVQDPDPGIVVPADSVGDPVTQPDDNGELQNVQGIQLLDEDKQAAYDVVKKMFADTDMSRRAWLRRVLRGRAAFDGKNNVVWDDGLVNYIPMNQIDFSQYGLDEDETDLDPVLNWNMHQATGLYVISAQGAGRPTVRWYPADANNPLDVLTARKCDDVIDFFYRTNPMRAIQNRMGFLHWNDGSWFGFVRFKRDAQRWGTHDEPVYGVADGPIGPPFYQCQNCGAQTPQDQAEGAYQGTPPPQASPGGPPDQTAPQNPGAPPGMPPPAPSAPGMSLGMSSQAPAPQGLTPPPGPGMSPEMSPAPPPPTCQGCGYPMDPTSLQPPPIGPVRQQIGVKQVANGAVVLDTYGIPEVRVPPEGTSLPTCGYLALQTEEDVAFMRATYPKMAEKIRSGSSASEESLVEEKISRLSLKTAMNTNRYGTVGEQTQKITWTRIWLRPWQLAGVEDENSRRRLMAAFPKGAFWSFAGNVLCEHKNVSMDDYWVWCPALPGDSMVRPPTGEILLDPNDGLNDLMDSEMSAARHAVPFALVNQELLSGSQVQQGNMRGGNMLPVEMKDGRPPGDQVYEFGTSAMPQAASSLRQEIFGHIGSWLSGATPGLTGVGDPNLKTKGAYEQARDQALGRQNIPWEHTKEAFVRICELVVKHTVENMTDDITFTQMIPDGFKNVTIQKGELLGKVMAFAEEDENYPVSMTEKKDNLFQLQAVNPAFGAIPQDLDNLGFVKATTSLGQVKFPGEKAREKQLDEIKFLSQGTPLPPTPIGPGINPMTGMPDPGMPPQMGPPMPSVPISPKTEDNHGEWQAGVSWLQTDEARQLKLSNQAGYENVVLHIAAHFDAWQNGVGMQPAGMPPGPPPGPGGPGGPPKGPQKPTPNPPPPGLHPTHAPPNKSGPPPGPPPAQAGSAHRPGQ